MMFGITAQLNATIWFQSQRNIGATSGGTVGSVGDDQVGYTPFTYANVTGLGIQVYCGYINGSGYADVTGSWNTNAAVGSHYIGYFSGGDDIYVSLTN